MFAELHECREIMAWNLQLHDVPLNKLQLHPVGIDLTIFLTNKRDPIEKHSVRHL